MYLAFSFQHCRLTYVIYNSEQNFSNIDLKIDGDLSYLVNHTYIYPFHACIVQTLTDDYFICIGCVDEMHDNVDRDLSIRDGNSGDVLTVRVIMRFGL